MENRLRFLLVVLALVAFGNAVRGSFHFDDYSLFVSGVNATRPLTYLTFRINNVVSGQNPLTWHIFDLLLHTGCVLLLFEALRRLLPVRTALIAAALFAVHPIQTEAVAYVFARSTLMMTLFCLASFLGWIESRRWMAVGWFALALLSKEECVFFPVFLMLFEAVRSRKYLTRETLAMLLLSASAGIHVMIATANIPGAGAGFSSAVSLPAYAAAQGFVIWRYFALLLWPTGLTVDPDLNPAIWLGIAGWLALAAAVFLIRRYPAGIWSIGGIVLLLASSSVFPASDLAADRRLYFPMIAFTPAIALLLARVPGWIPVVVIAALIPVSIARTEVWRTERSLWWDAVEKAPRKVRPRIQLSRAVPPEDAISILNAVERTHPDDSDINAEKGRAYLQMKRPDLALGAFGRASALSPANAQNWSNLGVALAMLGQTAAAEHRFRQALKLNPCLADARKNLHLEPCAEEGR